MRNVKWRNLTCSLTLAPHSRPAVVIVFSFFFFFCERIKFRQQQSINGEVITIVS